jgi:hypothetical protein
MERLSRLPGKELMKYLAKIRRIAGMDDSDALKETNKFIFSLRCVEANAAGDPNSVVNYYRSNHGLKSREELNEFRDDLLLGRTELTDLKISSFENEAAASEPRFEM